MIADAKQAPTPKERPFLFSAPMVRAILEGRKTQMRRVIKPQPVGFVDGEPCSRSVRMRSGHVEEQKVIRCPYGQVGDRLWVRETWGVDSYRMLDGIPTLPPSWLEQDGGVLYRADGECCDQIPECLCATEGRAALWRPSIHMPRWASRITLEITDVRVERLHSISEDDARAEGVLWGDVVNRGGMSFRDGFRHLWGDINGADSWGANHWVWVLSFRAVKVVR